MADNRLFVDIDPALLDEAKKTVVIVHRDGENDITLTEENLPAKVDLQNPYKFDLTHFLPNLVPLTLDRFFEYARQVINDAASRAEQPTVSLVEEYPPLDMAKLGNEVITFRVLSREPANMSADGLSRPQRRYRRAYAARDADVGDNIIEIFSRPLDHEIEFTIWATENKIANKRAIWLENLFVAHAWAFRSQGADRFHFIKRLSDGYITTGNQRLFYRPLRFFLRFSEFMAVANYDIKNITVDVRLTSQEI